MSQNIMESNQTITNMSCATRDTPEKSTNQLEKPLKVIERFNKLFPIPTVKSYSFLSKIAYVLFTIAKHWVRRYSFQFLCLFSFYFSVLLPKLNVPFHSIGFYSLYFEMFINIYRPIRLIKRTVLFQVLTIPTCYQS